MNNCGWKMVKKEHDYSICTILKVTQGPIVTTKIFENVKLKGNKYSKGLL